MKKTRFFAALIAAIMVLSMCVSAFAVNSDGESYTRGSITIKNPQDGVDYKAYKIFDVTYDLGGEGTEDDKYAYTVAPAWEDDVVAYATPANTTLADGWTTTSANGLTVTKVLDTAGNITAYNVTIDGTFSAADFGEKMNAAIGSKTPDKVFTDGKATGLDLGYYMVQPTSANSLVSLTTTDKDVQVSDKNEQPKVDKNVVEGETKADHTTKSVGDKVDFELDAKVPDMTGYETYFFVMNDTMTAGLTFNEDVVITIGGKAQTLTPLTAGTDYTVKVTNNEDGTTNIRIVFKDMKQYWSDVEKNDWEGEPIVIKYSATVDEDAVMGTIGSNTNTAKIEYSNNPNIVPEWTDPTEPDPENPADPDDPKDPNYKHNGTTVTTDDPTGEGPEDKVTVYTAELDITKVDAANPDTTTLAGAKFKIEGEKLNVSIVNSEIFERDDENGTYYRLTDGTYTNTPPYNPTEEEPEYTYEEMPDDFEPTTENEEDITYNTLGLYYVKGQDEEGKDIYEVVTETKARELAEDNTIEYFKQIQHKQSYLYENIKEKYKKVEVIDKTNTGAGKYTAEGFVDKDGKITFAGLAEGTYFITELIAPDGYNLLKEPVEIVVKLMEVKTAGSYEFSATIAGDNRIIREGDGVLSFNVANSQGIELPETGGIGTTIFYIAGCAMLLGAAVVLITRKRVGDND